MIIGIARAGTDSLAAFWRDASVIAHTYFATTH